MLNAVSAISVENLSKTYPESFPRLKRFFRLPVRKPVKALKNVSLEIKKGEIFGIIGSNGAGKTTLTKIIATLVQPTEGRVFVSDYDSVKDEIKVRSLIGLATAEERSFYWRLTCDQNMLFFARLYGMDDKTSQVRIPEIFARLNLTELAKRRFSELSTGNKQRLAVARALLPSPPVLLLDEPTRSLDPLAAASMRELILSLKDVSVLLTSHNLSEVEELCQRVAIIAKGEIKVIDTPHNLRLKHQQTQKVRVTMNNISKEILQKVLLHALQNAEIESQAETLSISFRREADDRLLGETIAHLVKTGARILDVETEKPTLLDVLESYK